MHRTPFTAFTSANASRRAWQGVITRVRTDDQGVPSLLYDVQPLFGYPATDGTSLTDAEISVAARGSRARSSPLTPAVTDVRMLVPLCVGVDAVDTGPDGVFLIPDVGAYVMVAPDDTGWVIVGCYTGPVVPATERQSAAGRAAMNSGLEEALSRATTSKSIPWLFGLQAGSINLARGASRVKLVREGLVLGSPAAMTFFNPAQGLLYERYVQRQIDSATQNATESAYAGHAATMSRTLEAGGVTLPTPDAWSLESRVIRSAPATDALKAYLVEQRGHIPVKHQRLGRSVIASEPGGLDTTQETAARTFGVHRSTVVQPLAVPTPQAPDITEMDRSAVLFDFQVQADGSFHVRGGNSGLLPGASVLGEASKLDAEISYDAAQGVLRFRLGPAGAAALDIQADLLGNVTAKGTKLKLEFKTVEISADTQIKLTAPVVDLDTKLLTSAAKNFAVTKGGTATALTDVKLQTGVSLLTHVHSGVQTGGGASGPPK